MKFLEQLLLELVDPVVGSALIGGAAAFITRKYQNRRLDRQVRMDLVSDVSEVFSAMHTALAFYERWVRHSQPAPCDRDLRRAEVDRDFINQRITLGALQTKVDAYFGNASEPGVHLHRLSDLAMLRYAFILELPSSQLEEMIDHLGKPGHSGYSVTELEEFTNTPRSPDPIIWSPVAKLEQSFMQALRDTVCAILATKPADCAEGFKSNKLLTAYDQRDPAAESAHYTVAGRA